MSGPPLSSKELVMRQLFIIYGGLLLVGLAATGFYMLFWIVVLAKPLW